MNRLLELRRPRWRGRLMDERAAMARLGYAIGSPRTIDVAPRSAPTPSEKTIFPTDASPPRPERTRRHALSRRRVRAPQ